MDSKLAEQEIETCMSSLNIYCDESTHLPNDQNPFMVLGAITCPTTHARDVAVRLREIRKKHQIPGEFEIKWTKVSPAKIEFYLDIIDCFFDDNNLNFRAVIAPKQALDHSRYNQTHDDWYYKMMYYLIRYVLPPQEQALIYLDKKDSNGKQKVSKLKTIMANSEHDFDRRNIRRWQIVESHHVGLLQLADLLIGAINYANRGETGSQAKLAVINRVRQRSGLSLTQTTSHSELKMNLFHWAARA